jgi:hypothetical protein
VGQKRTLGRLDPMSALEFLKLISLYGQHPPTIKSRMPMLRKLYRLDEAARRMRFRVLSVVFAAAVAIIIAMIVLDFVGH